MSSNAELTLGSLHLDSSRNHVDPNVIWLFRPCEKLIRQLDKGNRIELSKYVVESAIEEFTEDNPFEMVQYLCSGTAARDRLELKGFTLELSETSFKKGLEKEIRGTKYFLASTNISISDTNLHVLNDLTIQSWMNALERIRNESLDSETLATLCPKDQDLPLLQYMLANRNPWFGFPGFSLLCFLRLAVERFPPCGQLVYDLTDLVYGGYIDKEDEHVSESETNINADVTLAQKTIILAEGVSDIRYLQRSLRLLYPHLVDYFHFFDFSSNKFPGGASVVANLVRAFAATEVRNRIIGLFDNDTAGRTALQSLDSLSLPPNIVVRHYPNIALARNYPTLGPTGEAQLDVNGLAGSIELYLGQDVLRCEDGKLQPVLWKGYDQKSQKYQGEILDKKMIQNRFENKLSKCEKHPERLESYDWEEMKNILNMLRTAFHALDTKTFLADIAQEISA